MKRRLEEEARGGKRGGTNTDNDSNVKLGRETICLMFNTSPGLLFKNVATIVCKA